jgi:hypothetical protein
MIEKPTDIEHKALLDGLKLDAARFFIAAEEALDGVTIGESVLPWRRLGAREQLAARDMYWAELPDETRSAAQRLNDRLVSLMGQIALTVRSAPLASEADQRDLMTGTKAMRAALLLRRFRSWSPEVLNDEDIVLGVTPAGQSDDEPLAPAEAGQVFADWTEKVAAIIDLVVASPTLGSGGRGDTAETARYRPGTAFIMMWMDNLKMIWWMLPTP